MNVNDQWMLERMQQMAATMASSVPQTSQNTDTTKTEKGESFQDMVNKAKDQKVEAPKKTETVQKKEQPQKIGSRKVETVKNADGTETTKVQLTAQEAAAVAAGYAHLSPVLPDGTVALLISVNIGEGGEVNPLMSQMFLGQANTNVSRDFSAVLVDGQWVVEPSDELATTLEQFLTEAGDLRSADSIMDALTTKFQEVRSKIEVVVTEPGTEQTDDQDETTDLDGSAMNAQPLFKDVKATPVKVGENFELDTQEPDMDAQLADTIQQAAQQGLRQVEIKLSPENLGALTIKLTQSSDGLLQVVLHTTNAKAANLLSQHMEGLNVALQSYGQVKVEVQRGENSQQAEQQPHQQADPDGHNQQQQQQHRQDSQHSQHSQDFVQRLRLGLFGPEDMV